MNASFKRRFYAKVNTEPGQGPGGECHEWSASRNESGYGKFSVSRGKWRRAHRVAWFLATGAWPEGMVLHRCDNPPCVRLDHLFLGDERANKADMVSKGRQARGTRLPQARLTPERVIEIRATIGTHVSIGERFGVTASTVGDILRRETWKHV
jgi:hypothetical protein